MRPREAVGGARVYTAMNEKLQESEVLDLLRAIETREITIVPEGPEAPSDVGWGNAYYLTSNGWKVAVFIDSYDWDNLEQIEAPDGRVLDYDGMGPELQNYSPPPDVVAGAYLIRDNHRHGIAPSADRRDLKERIQDEWGFGVEIRWSVHKGAAQFEVHELDVTGNDGRRESTPAEAVYLRGFVKSDGCTEIALNPARPAADFGDVHWCGFKDWQRFMSLLGHLYLRAFDLMGCEPDEHSDAEGRAVYRAAVAAREGDRRLARYVERCRELDNFPADPAKRGVIEEVRLHQLVADLDDLYRALTPEQQRQVDAPGAKLARARN
jgi:hypothetical protein